jgi:hypothetical protein
MNTFRVTPGSITNNKVQVMRSDIFTYINPNVKKFRKDMMDDITTYTKSCLHDLYFRKLPQITVNTELTSGDTTGISYIDNIDKINDNIHRLYKKYPNENVICKVRFNNSKPCTIYFHMISGIDDSSARATILFYIFNDNDNVCEIYHALLRKDNCFQMHSDVQPLMVSKKDYDIDNFIRKHNLKTSRSRFFDVIDNIQTTLDIIISSIGDELMNNDLAQFQYHTKLEKSVLKMVFTSSNLNDIKHLVGLNNWHHHTEAVMEPKFKSEVEGTFPKVIMGNEKDGNIIPIVDLSKREWKFINEYLEDKYEKDEAVDLGNALIEKRFGIDKTLKVNVFKGTEEPSIFHFEYDQDSDCCEFYIKHDVNHDMSIIALLRFVNLHDFKVANISLIDTYIHLKNPRDNFPAGICEVMDFIPKGIFDLPGIIETIMSLCAMLLVLHDRPERSKMIKETKLKQPTNTHATSSKSRVQNNKPEYAIRHILMTSNEAKSYIREATKKGGIIKREYYVDSWERRGFWRKNRNGTMVYIGPTICNRHLELSKNKEVHIKL